MDGSSDAQLRSTTDEMMSALDRLRAIELEKRSEPIGGGRFQELVEEASHLSRLVFRWAGLQVSIATQATAPVPTGRPPQPSIEDVEARPLDRVLWAWREAESRLHHAAPGSAEARQATDDLERLRDGYRRVHDRLMAGGGGSWASPVPRRDVAMSPPVPSGHRPAGRWRGARTGRRVTRVAYQRFT
jgi:hypothetical protein